MAATTKITLCCDAYNYDFGETGDCQETIETFATLVGKNEDRAKLQVKIPEGWWLGHERGGYGYGPDTDIKCACPRHAKKMRGY